MLRFIFRKMASNKWMVLCLLIGFMLAVGMISSIPMYTDGVLQRMLTRDLENYQINTGGYPGTYHVKIPYGGENWRSKYLEHDKSINAHVKEEMGIPYLSSYNKFTVDYIYALPEVEREEKPKKRFFKLEAVSNMESHVDIIHGKYPSNEVKNGVYEVMVSQEAFKAMDLLLDEVYTIKSIVGKEDVPFRIKVVGVFNTRDMGDGYWFQGILPYKESFIMDYAIFYKDFVKNEDMQVMLKESQWYFALDYHAISIEDLSKILNAYKSQKEWFASNRAINIKFPAISIIDEYYNRAKKLKVSLWILDVPIILMLTFYLSMISKLVVDHDRNEIAVMQSRGAGSKHVFLAYLMESAILAIVAIVVGPLIGFGLCQILGAANGFLEFVDRVALPVVIKPRYYLYALGAGIFAMMAMLIPVVLSGGEGIVQHKRQITRTARKPIWQRYYIDIVLLAISAYGIYTFRMRQKTLVLTGVQSVELGIDPVLFVVSVFFILGIGLFFIRLYPYIIRLIFWLGKKRWSSAIYASFVQIGRSRGQNQFLMIFLMLALSVGLFSANAARTVNANMEERIRYEIGADITIKGDWQTMDVQSSGMDMDENASVSDIDSKPALKYIEPPFEPYTKLSDVELVTKVFRTTNGTVQLSDKWLQNVYIMGIVPHEFGKVSWFRGDLLKPYHWYQYLNLLSKAPKAFLISSNMGEDYNIKQGDNITIKWGDQDYLDGVVYGIVDYWPTYNPNIIKGEKQGKNYLVVANLAYIQAKTSIEPYEVWLKKSEGANSQKIYDEIKENKISVSKLTDASQQIIMGKNDPMLQGMNGALTLGFVISMLISAIGFLIYWILSIQKRTLQFGVLRAMGMPKNSVLGMLIWEQIMTSGIAVIVGIVIGGMASELFVPFLQLSHGAAEQVPPFKVLALRKDYIKVYLVMGIMLTLSFLTLAWFISHIKIHQALKLGED
ncbi:MAG: ABC transporter permease [Xylanivirga thermophila]|uniref:ABC transporter permease n=1 Tax=Xylanivirga thermophila TaxID=2496273 RepID=UPI0039F59AF0